jgi:hypothetical protein
MTLMHDDKIANPRGAAVIGVTGGWHRLCCEHGHHLVISFAAVGVGPGCLVKPFWVTACGPTH